MIGMSANDRDVIKKEEFIHFLSSEKVQRPSLLGI